ncbi:hypothetical protein [Methanocella conradii]|uniref:hypothetical protein n=1 Tax=Methanocella conradii TaxID=1175444 RepID=UPI00157DC006|nr:hypothetical protein [Methanocella conradii]
MPVFYRISFSAEELEALRQACAAQSSLEDRLLDEAAAGTLEEVAMQETKADDMLLIKNTIPIFKPGQAILITGEDLHLMRKSLENFKGHAPPGLAMPVASAIKKIDESLQRPA